MLFSAGLAGLSSHAAEYPDRPIKILVSGSVGGATDFVGRLISPLVGQKLGQNLVLDNKVGASGMIGVDLGAKSAPDGYTFVLGQSSGLVIAPHLQKVPYDTLVDFAPVTMLAFAPNLLVVNAKLPVRSVKDLIAFGKSNKDSLNFSSFGAGSSAHIEGEMLNKAAGLAMKHVPYKGAGPALNGVVSGEVQVSFLPIPTVAGHLKSGTVRALAALSPKRLGAAPEVPTNAEVGLPDIEVGTWFGLLAPAKTPPSHVQKMFRACHDVLNLADIRGRLTQEGCEVVGSDPETFARFLKAEYGRYAKIVKDTGIQI